MNRTFKGAAKPIENIDLPRIGHEIGVGEDEIHAFMDVEANGSPFDNQGRLKALYEPHRAYALSSGETRRRLIDAGLAYRRWGEKPYPKDSYDRITRACAIDEAIALKSTSWGATQIMGSNYHALGYATVQDMVEAFMDDAETHIAGAVRFMVANGIDDEMRRLASLKRPTTPDDCVGIVSVYNGAGFRKNNYHVKLAKAHNKWRGIKDTPWSPKGMDELVSQKKPKMIDKPVSVVPAADKPAAANTDTVTAPQKSSPALAGKGRLVGVVSAGIVAVGVYFWGATCSVPLLNQLFDACVK